MIYTLNLNCFRHFVFYQKKTLNFTVNTLMATLSALKIATLEKTIRCVLNAFQHKQLLWKYGVNAWKEFWIQSLEIFLKKWPNKPFGGVGHFLGTYNTWSIFFDIFRVVSWFSSIFGNLNSSLFLLSCKNVTAVCVATIRVESVGPLRRNYQGFFPAPHFNVDSHHTDTDSTI